jgi:arylsulfatase A-like enzyme
MSVSRPNVIFVLTDDQGYWAMGCSGNREIRTPNLDRLAGTGIRFENFFCTSPVCSPARASIMTGRIPSQHGVHDWIRGGNMSENGKPAIEYLRGQTAYTDVMAASGYTCGLSGKWHLGHSLLSQKGFSHWYVHQKGGGNYRGAPMIRDGEPYEEPSYVTDAITDDALAFLADQDAGKPFYLGVHYTAPHSPWVDQHPQAIVDSYDDCPFSSCPDEAPHPWKVNSAPSGSGDKRREILKGYFAAVTAMDHNVGRILDYLEEQDLRDRTLVVFMSDNGMNMGHHGFFGKGNGTFPLNMYETSVKVPCIVSHPGSVSEGVVEDGLFSQYDFMPTLLDYLELENPNPDPLPGRSFSPVLQGRESRGRREVVVFDEYGPVRMIRTGRWKYVHRYPYGPNELYDLSRDPGELENLYGAEEHSEIVEEMRSRLRAFFLKYADPSLDGSREAVYGKGQIDLVGKAGGGRKAFEDDFKYMDGNGEYRPSTYFPPDL